jgi:6-phosphogluconolactonase (cycloisomerase 2 family)
MFMPSSTSFTARLASRLSVLGLALTGVGFAASGAQAAPRSTGPVGAVYVASNAYGSNQILSFTRAADGTLTAGGAAVDTGGRGSGPGWVVAGDPLGSAGSLVADPARQLLFAVNAGSDSVSVFAARRTGLTLLDVESTNGAYPVSAAIRDDNLFVANAVGNSIAGFRVMPDGELSQRQMCPLPALPSGEDALLPSDGVVHSAQPVAVQTLGQVGFSPDGSKLLVISKEGPLLDGFPFGNTLGPGHIYVYNVDQDSGTIDCDHPTTTTLPVNPDGKGKFPFAFTWSARGQLLVVDVFGTGTGITGSSVSSFSLENDGALTPISVSVGNGEGAACWIVTSGPYAFVTNYLGDSISSYDISNRGVVSLLDPLAAPFGTLWGDPPTIPGSVAQEETPLDLTVTADGQFLYQLAPGSSLIRPFAVDAHSGALAPLAPIADGVPANSGQSGIATLDLEE